jgi:pyrimidine operon attenuation protein/uracil phosphoribosyltransferase
MERRTILQQKEVEITLQRLACQLIENHGDFTNTALIGLQPRGLQLANRLVELLRQKGVEDLDYGSLDITFFRDDFRRREEPIKASKTQLDFLVEKKSVVFIDDVLYTGRSVRAALDAVNSFGRPSNVELLVLINRRFTRQLPIEPSYIGRNIDSLTTEKVIVHWKETEGKDHVELISES